MLDWCHSDGLNVSNTLDTPVSLMVEVSLRRHDGGARAGMGAMARVCPGGDSRGLPTRGRGLTSSIGAAH